MATLIENVNKVVAAHAAIKAAVAAKGVDVPDGAKLTDIPALVAEIPIDTATPVPGISFYYSLLSGDVVLGSIVKCDFTQVMSVSNCFYSCSKITSLTLPDGFGSVATNVSNCFYRCSKITSLTLPDGFGSVATNVSYCFYSCTGLTSLTLPDGFGSVATSVSNCFSSCTGLTSLTLPDGFGSVATNVSNCFYRCSKITSLTLPDGFGSVATNVSYCFYSCTGLTSLTLPDGFGSVATNVSNCFYSCSSLKTITGSIKFQESFSLSYCPLTHDSLMNVINGLVTVTTAQTLTLGSTNKAKLSEEEIAVATAKGWTIA